ncbi:MAG: glycosyltransferase family 2 protein [Bacteroidaceae bacterium]|nr:glycosyltransferase family 2 protein [Bacteroidaceae bacterium]
MEREAKSLNPTTVSPSASERESGGACLTIVIVSYNVSDYVTQCLHSVARAAEGLDVDVWVVDNASQDNTVERIKAEFPHVNVIPNSENVGFARANNQAIRLSKGKYVLLLNPDTVIGEDVLRTCISFLDANPSAGALGVAMHDRNGAFARESRRGLPTPATAFYKMSGLCSAFPTSPRFGRYYMGHLDASQPNQIEVISGAFMMARRDALEQVGLLDERYFMYGEDIDLSYSLMQAGWENWYLPCHILHYKGESTQKSSFRYVQNFYTAMLIFFDKNFAHRYRFTAFLIRTAVNGRAAISYMTKAAVRVWRKLNGVKRRQHSNESGLPDKLSLVFFGSDEGWETLQNCVRPSWQLSRSDNPYDAFDAATEPNCVVFDTDSYSYHIILEIMAGRNSQGHTASLGLISASRPKLILP